MKFTGFWPNNLEEDRMKTIQATCPACGDVHLTTDEVRLMVCNVPDRSYYAFYCTGCLTEVRKPADEHVVAALMAGGVTATSWEIPAEVVEPKTGPPISSDDVLDFALRLERADHLVPFARVR